MGIEVLIVAVSMLASLALMCATLLVMRVIMGMHEKEKRKDEQSGEKKSRNDGAA